MIVGTVRGSIRHPGTDDPLIFNDQLTEEDLAMSGDEVQDMVGDGNAKVSVSFGMSDKDFGNGFDAHISISLTCDQDREMIEFAYEAASDLAAEMCAGAFQKAKDLYKENT